MRQEQRREVAFSHSDDCAKSHRSAEARRASCSGTFQNLVISIRVSRVVMCSFHGTDLALHAIVRSAMDFTKRSMMVRMRKFIMAVILAGAMTGVGMEVPASGETLTVAAPPSLRAPFQEILRMFEQEYGASVEVRHGPSHTLRRQIEQGAPIDVFLSESWQEVETLHQKELTLFGGPLQYAQTSMVVVMSSASTATVVSVSEASSHGALRVALVDPKASSVGAIAAKALKQIDR